MIKTNDKIKNFNDFSAEEQQEIIVSLKKFLVRKQISDQNKELREIFGKRGSDYTESTIHCFNRFNSYFIGVDLYNCINNYENLDEYSFYGRSEKTQQIEKFNYDIACVCFSKKPGERIPNRVTLPIMIAYANMQSTVLSLLLAKKYRFSEILEFAADEVRNEYFEKYGKIINESEIQPLEEAHKFNTKANCKKWISYLRSLKAECSKLSIEEVAKLIEENLCLTATEQKRFNNSVGCAKDEAKKLVKEQQNNVKQNSLISGEDDQDLEFNEYANLADYDEMFSPHYEAEMCEYFERNIVENEINSLIERFNKKLVKIKKESEPGESE